MWPSEIACRAALSYWLKSQDRLDVLVKTSQRCEERRSSRFGGCTQATTAKHGLTQTSTPSKEVLSILTTAEKPLFKLALRLTS